MTESNELFVKETYLSLKPERDGFYAGLISFLAILIPTILYWENKYSIRGTVEAIPEKVFAQQEYWRLFTAMCIHSDRSRNASRAEQASSSHLKVCSLSPRPA